MKQLTLAVNVQVYIRRTPTSIHLFPKEERLPKGAVIEVEEPVMMIFGNRRESAARIIDRHRVGEFVFLSDVEHLAVHN